MILLCLNLTLEEQISGLSQQNPYPELSSLNIEAEEVDGRVSYGLDEAVDGETVGLDCPSLDLAAKRPDQL